MEVRAHRSDRDSEPAMAFLPPVSEACVTLGVVAPLAAPPGKDLELFTYIPL